MGLPVDAPEGDVRALLEGQRFKLAGLHGVVEDAAGLDNRAALERVVDQVHGLDLHPVAVTLARVTYLLAITPERLADRGELTIPVHLGDSVRWEQDDTLLSQGWDHGPHLRRP